VTGEKLPPHKIPLVGRFYGDAESQSSQGNRFYENLRKMNEHQSEIEGRRKAGEPAADYYKSNPEARLYRQADRAQREVSQLRKRKKEMVERGATKAQIEVIETRITNSMRRFNERVKELETQ
jgi:hypothetical protein